MTMAIKDVLLKNLGITKLTGSSLKEAISRRYDPSSDAEKRRINREIAHQVIKLAEPRSGAAGYNKKFTAAEKTVSLENANVLGINYFGPLDVTLEWKTSFDGTLALAGYRTDSGGDQVNVSKVFSDFNENIALVAWTGKSEGEITGAWEKDFLNNRIMAALIRDTEEDERAAIYNIIDGETLPGMFGWASELSGETVENINRETLNMLEGMFKNRSGDIWMALSAGGPIRYNKDLAYYSTLIKRVKEKYKDKVKILVDFKFMAGPMETLSVLEIPRETPQDIIKPNLEEFIMILVSSGLVKAGEIDKNTISEETVKRYAVELRKKYNLLGVLVSMDRSGLILVMQDRIIKEKGIKITQACPTGAGDSLKAGFLYALSRGKSFEKAVHTGNLFGAGTASMEGTKTVTPEKLAEIEALARIQNVAPEIEMPTPS